jgi:hypothetical protein
MTQDIHVRAKRTHLTPTGVVTAHVHQFGESALFGFDVYVGDNVAVETLHRASVSETNSTLEGAKRQTRRFTGRTAAALVAPNGWPSLINAHSGCGGTKDRPLSTATLCC